MAVEDALRALGLSPNEARVYLTLLRLGGATAYDVARKSGLYRPYVYDTLDALAEKSLVTFAIEGKAKRFTAAPPRKLGELWQETRNALREALPELNSIAVTDREDTRVSILKGRQAVPTVLKSVLKIMERTRSEQLVMGVDDRKYAEYAPTVIRQFIRRLEQKGLRERVLAREGDEFFLGGKTSDYRFIPREFFNPTATHIISDTVFIIVWDLPVYAIVIESPSVASSYRNYFELLWKTAKRTAKNKKPRG